MGLAGQQPSIPPLLDEGPLFQEECAHPDDKIRDFNEAIQLRDDKLFKRLEEWLERLEAAVMRNSAISSPRKSVMTPEEEHAEEKAHRASVVVMELEDKGRRGSARSSVGSPDAKGAGNDHRHRELRVALGQTEGADRERPPLRERIQKFLRQKLFWWIGAEEPEESETEVKEVNACRSFMQGIVNAWMFEAFFAVVIMTNSVVIAVQVEELAKDPGATPSEASFVINSAYTMLFTLELLLRIAGRGFSIFCGPEWAWSLLDLIVVSSSVFEFVLELALHQSGENNTNVLTNMRLLRILRIGRITRAIRVVRVVKFIRSLRALLYQIGNTLRVMVWSVVLLALIIFLFGLIFTDIASEYLARERPATASFEELAELDKLAGFLSERFGGLEISMHTLYGSITGGFTWIAAVTYFNRISMIYGLLFEAYIAFSMFAVLNVMTGVFCQSAMESAEKDHELILQNVVQEKAKYFRAVRRLFAQIDKNANGGITHQEFEAAMVDPALRAVFDALEINAADAWALFQQLDTDGDNNVDVDEFLEGCMILKGPARSIDVICIKRDMAAVRNRFDQQANSISQLETSLTEMLRMVNRPGGVPGHRHQSRHSEFKSFMRDQA